MHGFAVGPLTSFSLQKTNKWVFININQKYRTDPKKNRFFNNFPKSRTESIGLEKIILRGFLGFTGYNLSFVRTGSSPCLSLLLSTKDTLKKFLTLKPLLLQHKQRISPWIGHVDWTVEKARGVSRVRNVKKKNLCSEELWLPVQTRHCCNVSPAQTSEVLSVVNV